MNEQKNYTIIGLQVFAVITALSIVPVYLSEGSAAAIFQFMILVLLLLGIAVA